MKKIYQNKYSIVLKDELQDFETGQFLSIAETRNFVIIQVADSFFGGRFCTPAHKQYCDLEITYSLTNGLYCCTDGVKQKIGKNEAYLSYKGDNHELSSLKGCRFKTLAVNIKEGECSELFLKIKSDFSKNRKCSMRELSDIMSSILPEVTKKNMPFSESLLDSLIVQLLVKLARNGMELPEEEDLTTLETLPFIVNYIDSNFLNIYSADELSSCFGYDYGHICKTFKKRYGISPGKYISAKKMDYALTLLAGGKSVEYVSEKLNYSTPYNFSRAFKKHFGKSPANYIGGM